MTKCTLAKNELASTNWWRDKSIVILRGFLRDLYGVGRK